MTTAVQARSVIKRNAWAVYLALGAVLIASYPIAPTGQRNGLLTFINVTSAAAIAVGVRQHRPSARAAWHLLIVAQVLFITGVH